MKVFFCESSTKGNHYVHAANIGHGVRVFHQHMNIEPERITCVEDKLLEDEKIKEVHTEGEET